MQIINKSKAVSLASEVIVADKTFSRLRGLLGRDSLNRGEALIIKPCNSIHTFFMRFPIDVLFIGKGNKVIKAISGIKPFRLSGIYINACFAIELPSGVIFESSTYEGDEITIT
ncbi:MAG: DUF192 domain-containing protein [Candidatus Omnitrophica bacterium]|nr:DUF192 domain-containing protein [Candidatus Omnitrophota bacterium]MDD5238489.1 DUF192 domain-containing protein [Candidatus Omnitrophota bacterium]